MTPHTALHHKHEWKMASSITPALTPLPWTHQPDTRKWVHSLTTSSRPATIAPIICMRSVSPAALTMALDNERRGGMSAARQPCRYNTLILEAIIVNTSVPVSHWALETDLRRSNALNRNLFLSQTYITPSKIWKSKGKKGKNNKVEEVL